MSRPIIASMERGEREITAVELGLIMQVLGVDNQTGLTGGCYEIHSDRQNEKHPLTEKKSRVILVAV